MCVCVCACVCVSRCMYVCVPGFDHHYLLQSKTIIYMHIFFDVPCKSKGKRF